MINIYAIPPLITAIILFFIAVFVFIKNKKAKVNRLFLLFCLSLVIWISFFSLMYLSGNSSQALKWARLGFIGIAFIPTLMYHFIIVFLGIERKAVLFFIYSLSLPGLIFSQTKYIYKAVSLNPWGYYPVAGDFYFVFLIMFISLFFSGVFLLYKNLRSNIYRGTKQQQIKWICLGFFFGTFGVVDYIAKYPSINIYPFGYIFALLIMWAIAYAIVKYRLMDIEIFIKKTSLLIGVIGSSAVIIFIGSNFSQIYFKKIFGNNWWMALSLIGAIGIFIIVKAARHIVNLKDEEIHKDIAEMRSDFKKRLKRLSMIKDRELLAKLITRGVVQRYKLDFCAIALRRTRIIKKPVSQYLPHLKTSQFLPYYAIDYVKVESGFEERGKILKGTMIENDAELIIYLKQYHRPVEVDELKFNLENKFMKSKNKKEESTILSVISEMKTYGCSLIVPCFVNKEDFIGFLLVGNKLDGKPFTSEDIEFFDELATEAASPINRVVTHDERIVGSERHIEGLVQVIDAKDHYTAGHINRTMESCLWIARDRYIRGQLKKIPSGRWGLLQAARLHDLGKVGIDSKILNKPEKNKFTDEEFKEMRSHPEKSLHEIEFIAPELGEDIIAGIFQHHENHDGSGYPEGKKGEDIHLYARIIHVVDSFDAMITERVYKPAYSLEYTFKDLIKREGTFYDPQIVDAFLRVVVGKIIVDSSKRNKEGTVIPERIKITNAMVEGFYKQAEKGLEGEL